MATYWMMKASALPASAMVSFCGGGWAAAGLAPTASASNTAASRRGIRASILPPSVRWPCRTDRLVAWPRLCGRPARRGKPALRGCERLDLASFLRGQRPFRRPHVLLDLLRTRRAGDDAADGELRGEPGECELQQRAAALGAERFQPLDRCPVRVVDEPIAVARRMQC